VRVNALWDIVEKYRHSPGAEVWKKAESKLQRKTKETKMDQVDNGRNS